MIFDQNSIVGETLTQREEQQKFGLASGQTQLIPGARKRTIKREFQIKAIELKFFSRKYKREKFGSKCADPLSCSLLFFLKKIKGN